MVGVQRVHITYTLDYGQQLLESDHSVLIIHILGAYLFHGNDYTMYTALADFLELAVTVDHYA